MANQSRNEPSMWTTSTGAESRNLQNMDCSERVSARTSKGIPPVRYPDEAPSARRWTGKKSITSRTSSAGLKKQVEADRDEKIAALTEVYCQKKKAVRVLEAKEKIVERKLLKVTMDNPENIKIRMELEDELQDIKDHIQLLIPDIQEMDESRNDKVAAIRSRAEAEIEMISDDEASLSIEEEDETQRTERVVGWATNQPDVDSKEEGEIDDSLVNTEQPNILAKNQINAYSNYGDSGNVGWYTPQPFPPQPQQFQQQPPHGHSFNQPPLQPPTVQSICQPPPQHKSSAPPAQASSGNVDVVSQLVTALGNAFGGNSHSRREVIVKPTGDKDLPAFSGEPELWVQFRTEFERTTVKYKFDESENLIRLRKSLSGLAKTTVQHLMINTRNVNIIMQCLEKRFGRPRVVLNALSAKVKSCNNVSLAKPETIIEFGLAVQALVTNVMAFQEEGYLNSVELLDAVTKKLSPDLATDWFKWLSYPGPMPRRENLFSFMEWISMQMDFAYQRSDAPTMETTDKSEKRRKRGPGTVNVVTTEPEKCLCCQKVGHSLEKCWAFQKKSVDDRWKLVKASKLCISCLSPGHRGKDCRSRKECVEEGCTHRHHKLLHSERREKSTDNPESFDKNVNKEEPKVDTGSVAVIAGCDGPLPIVPVKLIGPNGSYRTYALLDSGASRSLIKRDVADRLGLQGDAISYTYKGITGNQVTEENAKRINVPITGLLRGSKLNSLRHAVTVEAFHMNPYSIDMEEIKSKWPHLRQVAAKSMKRVVPEVIVGNNNPKLILAQKIHAGQDGEPIGWRSELGWTVSGNFDNFGPGSVNVLLGRNVPSNEYLHNLIKQSFSFEDLGVKVSTTKGRNLDEKRAYAILEATTKKVDGQWETGLLWRKDNVTFPESETTALRRLEYTERKMQDMEFKKLYQEKINEYLDKGYIKKLREAEAAATSQLTYIVPHFGIKNPNKPGKFRLIMDAKSKSHGVSLNDNLLKGPDLIRPLIAVLINFRSHRIGLTGDIADMFHRVKIRAEDSDSQRLLWRNGDTNRKPDHYKMVVMIFGATSSPSSAIFVKNKNADSYADVYPRAVDVIKYDFYVDDCLSGGDSEEEVIELRRQISEIHESGGFVVCKWLSNSKRVIESVPVSRRAADFKELTEKEEFPGERVLGMWWNPEKDVFSFRLGLHKVKSRVLEGDVPTKREMCGLIMSLFDPLGLVANFKIKALILLQDVWRSGINWDDEIPTSVYEKWKDWVGRLEELKTIGIPRHYSKNLKTGLIQLHTLVDSSSEAFCGVSYLRVEYNGEIDVALVAAKARVAPLKKSTIPRLELQAALLGSRLGNTICSQLRVKITERYFWSDSTTVLQWLRSRSGSFQEFVANRVGEIQETTDCSEWKWVPTKLNVADLGTRYDSPISFDEDSVWFRGPQFLYDSPDTWNFEEQRNAKKLDADSSVFVVTSLEASPGVSPSIDEGCGLGLGVNVTEIMIPQVMRFSQLNRLLRATGAVRKVATFWLSLVRKAEVSSPWARDKKGKLLSRLEPEDLLAAEKQLFKVVQADAFPEEIRQLLLEKSLKKRSRLRKLSVMLDHDGILRLDGRIGAAECIGDETKFPVLLPSRHHITDLIVDNEHRNNAHQGVETVLGKLRRRFWIIDARHTVRRSWTRCLQCRLRSCRPVTPKMGNLPRFRLAVGQPPFTFTGIDLFGPLHVTVGRRHEKRWGVLLCCMTTRAVHLEIVHGLSTDELLMALSRFIDVRGRPHTIISDNGTNFVGASKVLQESWSDEQLASIRDNPRFHTIKWTFNPPGAPHMGGAWERLIQAVKKCLFVTMQDKFPKDTTLLTLFKSIENIMNSRPLTAVSTDPHDPHPITANDLLRNGCDLGPGIPAFVEGNADHFREQWKRSHIFADQFWKRWVSEFLPKLVRREKWNEESTPLESGDLVFIIDENQPRNMWTRGYISKTFPGADGQVRVAEITTIDSTSGRKILYKRPVVKLCPLGLKMEISDSKTP